MRLQDIQPGILFENLEDLEEIRAPRSAIDAYKKGKRVGSISGATIGTPAGLAIPGPGAVPFTAAMGYEMGGRSGGRIAAAKALGHKPTVGDRVKDFGKIAKQTPRRSKKQVAKITSAAKEKMGNVFKRSKAEPQINPVVAS